MTTLPTSLSSLTASQHALQNVVSYATHLCGHPPLAASFYSAPDQQYRVSVTSTYSVADDNQTYQDFYKKHIDRHAFSLFGTSLYDAYSLYPSKGLLQSGYRADHYCLNFLLPNQNNLAQPPCAMQLLWQANSRFLPPVDNHSIDNLWDKIFQYSHKNKVFDAASSDHLLSHSANEIGGINDQQNRLINRSGFILHWDISSYRAILSECGEQALSEFNKNIRDVLSARHADQYNGDVMRYEGDGAWMFFPCCGFDRSQEKELFYEFYMSADQMMMRYNQMRQHYMQLSIRHSSLKITLTRGDLMIFDQVTPYGGCDVDSIGFFRGRALMNKASRDGDSIVIDRCFDEYLDVLPIHARYNCLTI